MSITGDRRCQRTTTTATRAASKRLHSYATSSAPPVVDTSLKTSCSTSDLSRRSEFEVPPTPNFLCRLPLGLLTRLPRRPHLPLLLVDCHPAAAPPRQLQL